MCERVMMSVMATFIMSNINKKTSKENGKVKTMDELTPRIIKRN
jgi:hypothetical protein